VKGKRQVLLWSVTFSAVAIYLHHGHSLRIWNGASRTI